MNCILYLIGGPADLTKIAIPHHPGAWWKVPVYTQPKPDWLEDIKGGECLEIVEYHVQQVARDTFIGLAPGLY